ncbi:phosphotransferase [Granulosicoccaceae sp. 1_MG-2023]|nr:phosphotransferase [Granulosicoccaceae sp. 1_MG-2023]
MPDNDKRLCAMRTWLDNQGYTGGELSSASADASFRRYFRLRRNGSSLIVMDSPPSHNDNAPFIRVAGLFEGSGLSVPQILLADTEQGFLLLSDLGDTQYLSVLNDDNADALYGDALDALLRMQVRVPACSLPPYDAAALRAEMLLLPDWYAVRHKGVHLSAGRQAVIDDIFALCVDNALAQPRAFVHRDYHSRNLMQVRDGNPGILDFQDALNGPITYDAVSLLKDCYIRWPREKVLGWLEQYRLQLHEAGLCTATQDEFVRWFDLMGLQRHIKVMGIFCRLNYRDGKAAYMQDLPMVYGYIREVCQLYPECAAFLQLLDEDLGAAGEFA